jgi:opacity protein-like surface antigen
VVGYEVDFSFHGRNAITGASDTIPELKYSGTARTRLGYAQGQWLIYGTAGAAWAFSDITIQGFIKFDTPQVGYALGAGVEYALHPTWTARLEFLHADLGVSNYILGPGLKSDLTTRTLRVALNHRIPNWSAANAPATNRSSVSGDALAWTGPYFGVHSGYSWGQFDQSRFGTLTSLSPSGAIIGITSGYNWQLSRDWIFGFEGDTTVGHVKASNGPNSVDFDATGSVRARAAYPSGQLLIYATGGLAWAHANSSLGPLRRDQYYLGWIGGAGIERALTPKWSAKIEYLYSEYNLNSDTGLGPHNDDLKLHTVKVGLNYRGSILGLLTDR